MIASIMITKTQAMHGGCSNQTRTKRMILNLPLICCLSVSHNLPETNATEVEDLDACNCRSSTISLSKPKKN
jgi:hypothetical protein